MSRDSTSAKSCSPTHFARPAGARQRRRSRYTASGRRPLPETSGRASLRQRRLSRAKMHGAIAEPKSGARQCPGRCLRGHSTCGRSDHTSAGRVVMEATSRGATSRNGCYSAPDRAANRTHAANRAVGRPRRGTLVRAGHRAIGEAARLRRSSVRLEPRATGRCRAADAPSPAPRATCSVGERCEGRSRQPGPHLHGRRRAARARIARRIAQQVASPYRLANQTLPTLIRRPAVDRRTISRRTPSRATADVDRRGRRSTSV